MVFGGWGAVLGVRSGGQDWKCGTLILKGWDWIGRRRLEFEILCFGLPAWQLLVDQTNC